MALSIKSTRSTPHSSWERCAMIIARGKVKRNAAQVKVISKVFTKGMGGRPKEESDEMSMSEENWIG